jgi:hypothetical protein
MLIYTSVDDVSLAVEDHIANAKTLPVSKQPNEVLANFTATDLEAEGLGRRLDVQKARQPVHLHFGRTTTVD